MSVITICIFPTPGHQRRQPRFYLAPKLGDRVVSLAELIFETGPDGHVGTDLERFQIGYQFNDQATVWVGRFHTPYGYVNTALHHGVWLAMRCDVPSSSISRTRAA